MVGAHAPPSTHNMKKLTAWALLISTWFSLVAPVARVEGQVTGRTMEDRLKDVPNGLTFRLSEGSEGAEKRTKQGLAPTDPLSETDANGILKRLPAIKSDPDDQTDFAKRIGTLPVPKAGNKLPVKFPSDEMRAAPGVDLSGKALDVLRYSPEGEVTLAPDLSITFSQPMVAVTSQQQAAEYAPVELSPQVQGRWRWLGAKTLMFDTDKRFPMATKFTVRVPAGTKSTTGQVLAKDVTWTFTTPPPKVEQFYPGNGATARRDALMYLQFDQTIAAEAVMRTIAVTAGGRRLPLRLATEAEIQADGTIGYYAKQAQPGRWLAFRAVNSEGGSDNALPAASTITVNVQKGTPSAEGPLTTTADQTFTFQTYGPFKFRKGICNFEGAKTCSPFDQWMLEFTNQIDSSKFDKSMIKIEPAVEGLSISPGGQYISISGYKKGNTTYTVTVDPSLVDIFGQKLGSAATATFRVGRAEASLSAQGGAMTVLDPTAKQTFSIYTTNHNSAKVRLYAVRPEDWRAFQDYLRQINYDDGKRPEVPGRLVSDEIVNIENRPDEMVETRIDVSKALNGGYGNVIVDIEPTVKVDKYDRTRVFQWLQSTQIGLDAFVDSSELVGFATELRTGKPLADVDVSIYPNGTGVSAHEALLAADEPGLIESLWNWVTGVHSGGPSDVTATDESGNAVNAEPINEAQSNRTGDNGILRLQLPESWPKDGGPNMLIARRGKDIAFLPENAEYWYNDQGSWYKKPQLDQLRWFTFDDRKLYKPKEEVSVKGYVRNIQGGKLGDVAPLPTAQAYYWSAKDPRNNEIAKGKVTTNAFGAFDLEFKLPDNANLGYARVDFASEPDVSPVYSHQFQIQEFRRPEFEVSAKVESEGPFFVGQSANASVQASYYAGGGLANAETNWTVTATPTNYTPPNRGDYVFGQWTPWWGWFDYGYGRGGDRGYGGSTEYFKGVTDASGKHLLKMDFVSANPPRPYAVTASASVQDVNRQTWSSTTSLLVHPSSLYVGIKTARTFVQKGEKITIESIVSDIDGNLVAGRYAEIKAVLKDWQFEKGGWVEKVFDEQSCTVRSAATPQKCDFIAKAGGRYTITATVMDDKERFNQSEMTVWVPGGKQPPKRNVEQEQVQIIPSKKEYAPGDVAELLVIAPFTPAEGVLTLRRDGIVKTERFTMKDSSITLKVPIDEKYLPNITAQVDLVGAASRTDDKGEVDPKLAPRPAYASGSLPLAISTASRHLSVDAEAIDKTLAPGAETKVNVEVKDSRGEPVANSEVALVMVDESVLALSRYTIADPLDTFYSARGTGTTDYHLRQQVLLANPGDLKKEVSVMRDRLGAGFGEGRAVGGAMRAAPAPMMAKSANMAMAQDEAMKTEEKDRSVEQNDAAIALRQNFDALALWSPTVKTDSNGHAVINVKIPDNLTRYRITAVAVDAGNKFGKSESNLTARQPLMVRPSAPRFMNFGDKVELPVVVQNQTDKDMAVDVAIRATNARLGVSSPTVTEGSTSDGDQRGTTDGRRVIVKANDRVEVRFPVSTVKAGTARFQIAVSSGAYSDAAEISLPVWTPATTEAFATYGTTDQNGAIVQPVQTPGDVFPQFGGLEVTTSSTQLQELTDAYISLYRYPYECSEQISSRMISTAALRDVLTAFKAKEMPTQAEIESQFKRDIEILQSRQRDDGSFGLWKKERERYEYPFLTIHVAHALALSQAKGYKVPDGMLEKTKPYLKNVETHFDEWYKNSPQVRWTISAYALYVRDMMGDKDTAKAKRLLAEMTGGTKFNGDGTVADQSFQKAPFEALGWVLDVLANDPGSQNEVNAILHYLGNHTTETAATANFVTDYGDGAWLIMYSNRRADGVLLEALLKASVSSPGVSSPHVSKGSTSPTSNTDTSTTNLTRVADLIPKLVRGLLDHRVKGAWSNTQENVFILLALDKYFNTFEKVTPDFVSRIWLGNTYAGEQTFKGRSIDSNVLNIPMSYLTDQGGTSNLIIDREGAGRLYYRIGMTYAPKNLKLDPADYGFTVLRQYEAVDDKDDVKQNADGSWTIKSGARVRVRLTMVASARRYHVALVDQLPAGLEILNPELATTEAIPADQKPATGVLEYGSRSYGYGSWWWRQYWFEHQNFRDERAEAFASLLWEGVYNYSYVTRATTPGKFVVPPAKAEEMYHPETFGRTGTDFVTVE